MFPAQRLIFFGREMSETYVPLAGFRGRNDIHMQFISQSICSAKMSVLPATLSAIQVPCRAIIARYAERERACCRVVFQQRLLRESSQTERERERETKHTNTKKPVAYGVTLQGTVLHCFSSEHCVIHDQT